MSDKSLDDGAKELLAATVYREGEDGWAEWVVQLGERADLVEPHMLGVRNDMLVTIIEGKATSYARTARIVDERVKLTLTYDMAMWLLDVLPKAIARQYPEPNDDWAGTAAEPELIARTGGLTPTAPVEGDDR